MIFMDHLTEREGQKSSHWLGFSVLRYTPLVVGVYR